MKKRLIMLILAGAMILGDCTQVFAAQNRTSGNATGSGLEMVTTTPSPSHAMVTDNANEAKVFNYLTQTRGLNSAAACGIMVNMYQECRFIANNLQGSFETKLGFTDESYTKAVDNGTYTNFVYDEAGYGLCQWGYWTHKRDLLAAAKARGTSVGDLMTQLDYMWSALTEEQKIYLRNVPNTAQGAEDAGYYFCKYYEMPSTVESTSSSRGEKAASLFWPVWGNTSIVGDYPNHDATYTTGTYKVLASELTVRKGAGSSYGTLGLVSDGDKVKVTAVSGYWGKISFNGKEGWVSLRYCSRVEDPTPGSSSGSSSGSTGSESGSTGSSTSTNTPGTYQITASSLAVRSGADKTTTYLGALTSGTKVEVTEVSSNNWGKISYNGKTGWISLNYANKVASASGGSSTSSGANTATYQVTASALSVRTGAGTSYSKIGELANGTKVEVTEVSSNNWGKISYNGKTGWISLEYTKKVTSSTSGGSTGGSTGSTTASGDTYQITASSLTVRTDPDTTYNSIGALSNGTKVTVLEISSNNWGKISYSGKTGWISLKYAAKVSGSTSGGSSSGSTGGSTSSSGTVYEVTASSLSVRSGADTSYTKLGSLANGTKVTVLEVSSNNWGKISYNGKTGWISLAYAKKVSGGTTSTANYQVTASSLSVRTGAGTSYTKIGDLAKGTKVTVTEVKSNWGKINYNGKTGWISLEYCLKL